jgi:hypothetical protein
MWEPRRLTTLWAFTACYIFSTNIDTPIPSLYQRVETRSIEVFWLFSQPLPHLRFNLFFVSETFATELWTALRDQHFRPQTGNISLWISFASGSLFTKTHTQRCSSIVYEGRHFNYWNQPLNTRMRVCYLDCNEAGLCCYVVIHIENLLHPLHLFYFHLWSIYWFSLV